MSWKLAVLGVVVCAATALVVSLVLGGRDQTKSGTTEIVRVEETPSAAPAKSDRVSPRSDATDSATEKAKAVPPATKKPRPRLPLAGKIISVDPGHNGGNFTHIEEIDRPVPAGANGTTKPCNTTGTETNDGSLTEAQFNWDVARDLVPRLEHLGAKVVLTRDSNSGVGPCVNERAEIANHAHADVALSIHADGNLTAEGAHGFDVIHPSTAEMVAPQEAGPSLKLAEAERDALVEAGIPPANYVGEDGLDERSDLAGLNLAEVPAVLVELGNMRERRRGGETRGPRLPARSGRCAGRRHRRFPSRFLNDRLRSRLYRRVPMSYQDPNGRRQDDRFWDDGNGTPGWAKLSAVLIVAVGLGAAIAIFASRSGGGSEEVAQTVTVKRHVQAKATAKKCTRPMSARSKNITRLRPSTKRRRRKSKKTPAVA